MLDKTIPHVVVAAFAHNNDGWFVTLHRSAGVRSQPNCWSLPSGLHEHGKTLGQQMATELWEELSLTADSESWETITVYENLPGDGYHWCIVVGAIRVRDLNFVNNEPDKHDAVKLLHIESIMDTNTFDKFDPAARLAFNKQRNKILDTLLRRCNA